jgi:hypothetical protein
MNRKPIILRNLPMRARLQEGCIIRKLRIERKELPKKYKENFDVSSEGPPSGV